PTRFVVNIGDLLMRWTNDRWLSSLHRVVNPPAGDGRPRLSIAFFNHPNYDVTIECLASQGPARHPPVRSGDYRDLKYAKTGFTVYVRGPDMATHTPQRSSRPERIDALLSLATLSPEQLQELGALVAPTGVRHIDDSARGDTPAHRRQHVAL